MSQAAAQPGDLLLDAQAITRAFGMRPVLRGVELQVRRGECVALLGPNGAGKTTLLRILATLAQPSGGTLMIDGINALQQPAEARARIGMVSHQSLVYPDLTAIENLRFFGQLYGGVSNQRLETVLRQVNLWARAKDRARTFSRGMLQRLTIARAVLHDPALLLLDEPYTGLDQTSALTLSELLQEVALSGRAVVLTTHELSRGLEHVSRFLTLQSGKLAVAGAPALAQA